MKNTFWKKLVSHLTTKKILLWNSITVVFSAITLFFILTSDYEIGEKSLLIEGEELLLLVCCNYLAIIIAAILTSGATLKFRDASEYFLSALKSIAEGDFEAINDEKQDGKYADAYQSLNRVIEELKGSKEEMEQFTNEYLHEIKTPLSAIQGFAQILIETGDDIESPERMKYLQIIADESTRLTELSQNTLLLAKMDACQIVTDKVKYDMGEQIKNCVILFLPQLEKKEIELDIDVENLIYYGNREFMEQVWINLIGNALKFTPNGGCIKIAGIMEKERIILSFSDNGPGMDEETQNHIFEKFYQGVQGRQKGGNGIGLSIVNRIINLCNGNIEVVSELGKGTTFRIFLPHNIA